MTDSRPTTQRSASPLSSPLPWNLVAPGYVGEVQAYLRKYASDAVQLSGIGPDSRVLDVACGPGTLTLLAAAISTHVHAIDFSPQMIAELHTQAPPTIASNITAAVGDGMALPFPPAQFDAAFSMFGLIFFSDRARGLRELFRVLKPGGSLVIGSWAPLRPASLQHVLFDSLGQLLPGLPFSIERAPLGTTEEIEHELTSAGFANTSVRQRSYFIDSPSLDAMWRSMERSNAPLLLLRERLGESEWERVASETRKLLAARFGVGAQRLEQTANLALAYRPGAP